MQVEAHWQEVGSRPVRSLRAGAPHATVLQLVFVPGLNALDLLVPTLRACSAWTRVHLLDVPGFGDRRTSRFPSTLIDVADVIAEWLTVTDPPRAVLVGHSTGAQAAVRAARAVPERAEAVILAGPTFPPAARRRWPLVARVVRTFPTSRSVRCGRRFPSTCAAAVDC